MGVDRLECRHRHMPKEGLRKGPTLGHADTVDPTGCPRGQGGSQEAQFTLDRMEMLVQLHGCRYTDVRAESAPMTRKGGTTKATMASAAEELNAMGAYEMPNI